MIRNKLIKRKKNIRDQRKDNYKNKLTLTQKEKIQRKKDFLKFLTEKNIKTEKSKTEPRFKIIETKRRALGYTKQAKKIIRETPGLLKEFYEVSRARKREYTSPNGSFKIIRNPLNPSVRTTNVSYVVSIKQNKKYRKFFVKEINDSGILERTSGNKKTVSFNEYMAKGIDGVSEAKVLSLFKKNGIEIINHHFAFTDHVNKKSYIVYDYIPELYAGFHLKKQISKKQIPFSKIKEIQKYLAEVEKKVNLEIKDKKYGIADNRVIKDILCLDNVYYDSKKNKVFLFDPLLEYKDYKSKY